MTTNHTIRTYAVHRERGWKGQVVRRSRLGPVVDHCSHFHRSEATALTCAEKLAHSLKEVR